MNVAVHFQIFISSTNMHWMSCLTWLYLAPTKIKATTKDAEQRGKFTFFFGTENANGEFSQWYIKRFKVDNVWYICAEQYMMHQKAG
jgi:hypothetical protein